jgi:hypothetical protein
MISTHRRFRPWLALLVFVSPAVVLVSAAQESGAELPEPHPDMPSDFKQLIPRGVIASVDDPQFVSADEAEISDDAWVLGVVIDGQARAYSLNLLNHHEVVNDRIGDHPFAAVW